MKVKYNSAAMNRKAKFLAESAVKFSEIRTRMAKAIERLKDSYDGEVDSALFNQKSSDYIASLQRIEDSLVQYVDEFAKVSSDFDRINYEYVEKQRGNRNAFQIQK